MMIADCEKHSSRRRGFALLEVMIAVAVLAALTAYVLIGLRQQMHLGTLQQYLQDLDMQGSRIMQECAFRLRPAILPVRTASGKDNQDKAAVFALLDDPTNGFRRAEGRAWRTALAAGRIAFVVPVDAQGDGDTVDGAGRMEAGQIRSTGVSLDSAFIPGGAGGIGFALNPSGPACSLVRVSPDLLAKDGVGGAENIAEWPAALYGSGQPPQTSAFSVIRYVPVMNGGTPVLILENENIENENINGIGVDLNGDGDRNDTFHIGRLQLVHVGGTHAVQPPTTPGNPVNPAMTSGIPHEIVDLSGDVVLREVNPATPTPMFRYVGNGSPALEVRVNLFDPNGYQVLRARAPHQQRDALNRRFETVLTLRNMAR